MTEISIPIDTSGGGNERTTSSSSTRYHHETSTGGGADPGSGGESNKDFEAEIRKMEEEMERVRREAMNPTTSTSTEFTSSASGPSAAPTSTQQQQQHQTHSTKTHSYHKTTKTETKHVQQRQQPGDYVVNVSSQSIPRTIVREVSSSPQVQRSAGGPNEDVYRTTVSPGTTITIKASSHPGGSTPIKKVVIVNEATGQEQEINLDNQVRPQSTVREEEYYPRSSTPIHFTTQTVSDSSFPSAQQPIRDEERSEKREVTTSNDGARKEEIRREEHKKVSSYSSSTSTNKQLNSSAGDINTSFNNLSFAPDLEVQKRVGGESSYPSGSDTNFDWDSWASRQQQDFRTVETDPHTGEKRLKLKYELSPRDYNANDINVKVTKDNRIAIKAEHKETTGGKSVWRECSKEYSLPVGVNLNAISSAYNPDTGVLNITVPLPNKI